MTISTNYTKKDTLAGGFLDKYRFSHWLCDVMKNFMSDTQNIRDDRMRSLVFRQDGVEADECVASFQVSLPLSRDSRKACTTPAVLVSVGQVSYPIDNIGNGLDAINSMGGRAMWTGHAVVTVTARIAIVTESLDGTNLLGDLISEFLIVNCPAITADSGIASQLHIDSRSETQCLQVGESANAKNIFQEVIQVTAAGSVEWITDTQGPVYRGMKLVQAVS